MQAAKRKFEPECVLISIPQAAMRLGMTVSAIRNLIRNGELAFVPLGKRHLNSSEFAGSKQGLGGKGSLKLELRRTTIRCGSRVRVV